MNVRLLFRYLGYFCFALGGFTIPSVLWGVYFRVFEGDGRETLALQAFGFSIGIAVLLGSLLMLAGRRAPDALREREVLALVSTSWFVAAAIGALPFYFAGELGPVSSYFESMSGFTTTGSTVIPDIEAVPKSILFWRSFMQWLGGMGIIVLFVAVLPYLGAGGKLLFKSEATGPDPKGISPHIRDTASILYRLYLGLTLAQTAALMFAGLGFYDALTHTLATVSTGGFSTHQLSVGDFGVPAVEIIIIVFMVLAGSSFSLLFLTLRKDRMALVKDTEWRVYIAILVIAVALVSGNLMLGVHRTPEGLPQNQGYSLGEALRYGAFQTVSIMTSTGFGTDDFDRWPAFSRMLLFTLMFSGACAGSTCGGIKLVRCIMMVKIAYWRLEHTFRPKTIRAIRIGDHVIDDDVQKTVQAFFILYVAWFIGGSLFMSSLGLPFETAMSSVAATLNNIGPGLELVGSTRDYSLVPPVGKLFLSLCMVLGRLELFSVCVLFLPSFWRHS